VNEYLRRSRSAWVSFLFVLPLLALYHVGVVVTNLGQGEVVVNGADALLQAALRGVGVGGWFASAWFLAAVIGLGVYRKDPAARKERLQPRTFGLMLGESAVYAGLFGGLVAGIIHALMPWVNTGLQIGPSLGIGRSLTLSLGAGIYEELVFRVLLMGGLVWLFRRLLKAKPGQAAVGAVVVSRSSSPCSITSGRWATRSSSPASCSGSWRGWCWPGCTRREGSGSRRIRTRCMMCWCSSGGREEASASLLLLIVIVILIVIPSGKD
jgi:hypothetical protein